MNLSLALADLEHAKTAVLNSLTSAWDSVFQKIGASADPTVADCHPHRFRDTFAVSLLLKGVSLEMS